MPAVPSFDKLPPLMANYTFLVSSGVSFFSLHKNNVTHISYDNFSDKDYQIGRVL